MPYKNIVFIKLEKRILNDYRWYSLSDIDQLLYIKLILLAAETYNKIPKSTDILRMGLRVTYDDKTLNQSIKNIMRNFPKLKQNKNFYYFEEFEHKTNWVKPKELQRNSEGTPKEEEEEEEEEEQDIDIEQDKDKERTKLKVREFSEYFCKTYKDNLNVKYFYQGSKDTNLIKILLKQLDIEILKPLITAFFESRDPFIQKSGHTIGVFYSVINKLQAGAEKEQEIYR